MLEGRVIADKLQERLLLSHNTEGGTLVYYGGVSGLKTWPEVIMVSHTHKDFTWISDQLACRVKQCHRGAYKSQMMMEARLGPGLSIESSFVIFQHSVCFFRFARTKIRKMDRCKLVALLSWMWTILTTARRCKTKGDWLCFDAPNAHRCDWLSLNLHISKFGECIQSIINSLYFVCPAVTDLDVERCMHAVIHPRTSTYNMHIREANTEGTHATTSAVYSSNSSCQLCQLVSA